MRRYQCWKREGVVWSEWFVYKSCTSIEEAEEELARCKKIREVNRKLKGEYKIQKD